MATQIKYEIYMHTFSASGKSYIGMTKMGVTERLHKHYINACAGDKTHFYRAIRKYGLSNIKTVILGHTFSEKEAREMECKFIAQFDTFKNGYNMTLGGDGRNICANLSKHRYEKWLEKQRVNSSGPNNPNHSGLSDEYIVQKGYEFFINNGPFYSAKWFDFSKENGLPQNYSKYRFGGRGWKGFKESLFDMLKSKGCTFNENDFKYVRTEEHNRNLSKFSKNKNKKWYNDGEKSYILLESDELIQSKKLKKGRVNVNYRRAN